MRETTTPTRQAHSNPALLAASWLVVGAPLAYGVFQTLVKAAKLFTG